MDRQGRPAPRGPEAPRRARDLHGRREAPRHAPRRRAPERPSPRPHRADRHQPGPRPARRLRRDHGRGRQGADEPPARLLRRARRPVRAGRRQGALRRRGGGGGGRGGPLHGGGRGGPDRGGVRAAARRHRSLRGDEAGGGQAARNAAGKPRLREDAVVWRRHRGLRRRRPRDPPHAALASGQRSAARDGRRRLPLRPDRPADGRLVQHQHDQLRRLAHRQHPQGPRQQAEHPPHVRGRELRLQARPRQGHRDRRHAGQALGPRRQVHGGPGRQPARLREPGLRPLLRRRARRQQGRHLHEYPRPRGGRLRRLLPVRPRHPRQRPRPGHRALPHPELRVHRAMRADQQVPAGRVPRRGLGCRQLLPGAPGGRGRA